MRGPYAAGKVYEIVALQYAFCISPETVQDPPVRRNTLVAARYRCYTRPLHSFPLLSFTAARSLFSS